MYFNHMIAFCVRCNKLAYWDGGKGKKLSRRRCSVCFGMLTGTIPPGNYSGTRSIDVARATALRRLQSRVNVVDQPQSTAPVELGDRNLIL